MGAQGKGKPARRRSQFTDTVRHHFMALGQLLVELAVNSARMQGGFDSARSMAQRFSNDLKTSFNQLGSNLAHRSARYRARKCRRAEGQSMTTTDAVFLTTTYLRAFDLNGWQVKVAE